MLKNKSKSSTIYTTSGLFTLLGVCLILLPIFLYNFQLSMDDDYEMPIWQNWWYALIVFGILFLFVALFFFIYYKSVVRKGKRLDKNNVYYCECCNNYRYTYRENTFLEQTNEKYNKPTATKKQKFLKWLNIILVVIIIILIIIIFTTLLCGSGGVAGTSYYPTRNYYYVHYTRRYCSRCDEEIL